MNFMTKGPLSENSNAAASNAAAKNALASNLTASHSVGLGLAVMTSVLGAVYFVKFFKPAVERHFKKQPDRATQASARLTLIRRRNRAS
jgi:hypothetical protein